MLRPLAITYDIPTLQNHVRLNNLLTFFMHQIKWEQTYEKTMKIALSMTKIVNTKKKQSF